MICEKEHQSRIPVNVTEDIAVGQQVHASAYTIWYNSLGHRPALISTDYNYCGIGVVTYEGKIEWSLIVSQYPCGKTIDGVSGTNTNTRTINAYPKYFGKGLKIYADAETDYYMGENYYIGEDGWTNYTISTLVISAKRALGI